MVVEKGTWEGYWFLDQGFLKAPSLGAVMGGITSDVLFQILRVASTSQASCWGDLTKATEPASLAPGALSTSAPPTSTSLGQADFRLDELMLTGLANTAGRFSWQEPVRTASWGSG